MEKDEKVKDVLKKWPKRNILGHKVIRTVGRRAWERPNVAISSRLYEIYAIPDPFLPKKSDRKWLIGLGPVSLKLGENRRQPAPHLRPKPPPSKKKANAVPQLPNVPRAQTRRENPKKVKLPIPKPPGSDPADKALQAALEKQRTQGVQRTASSRPAPSKLASEFGGNKKHKLARLPVRPDLQVESSPPQSSVSKQQNTPNQPVRRSIPKPPESKTKSNGRIRMKRTMTKPRVIQRAVEKKQPEGRVTNSSESINRKPPEPKQPEIKRTASPKAPNSMSLDDLFGFSGGDNKPIRLRSNRSRPKKKKT